MIFDSLDNHDDDVDDDDHGVDDDDDDDDDEVRSTEDVMLGHSRLPHLPASSLHTNTMCAADGEDDDADCEGIE